MTVQSYAIYNCETQKPRNNLKFQVVYDDINDNANRRYFLRHYNIN